MQSHINVSYVIIEKDGLILATQRGQTMNMPLRWEFPGGKLDSPGSGQAKVLASSDDVN